MLKRLKIPHFYISSGNKSYKLLDTVENRFKTQRLSSNVVCPRVIKMSPSEICNKFEGCEQFFTKSCQNRTMWLKASINYYEESNLKIVQAQGVQAVDNKSETDLLYSYIPEYNLARDISQLIFSRHINSLMNQGKLFFGLEQNIIRGLRFAFSQKREKIEKIVICDKKPNSKLITNWLMRINNLQEWQDIIQVEQLEVFDHLIRGTESYDVIDLEITKSSLGYLQAIIPSLNKDGIISLNFPDTQQSDLEASIKTSYTYNTEYPKSLENNETILRRIYYAIDSITESFNLTPQPLFYVSPGMFIKIYFKLKERELLQYHKLSLICEGCQNTINAVQNTNTQQFSFQTQCQFCETPFTISGPLWNHELVDSQFLEQIINKDDQKDLVNHKTIKGMFRDHIKFSKIKDLGDLKQINFDQLCAMMGTTQIQSRFIIGTFQNHNFCIHQSPFDFSSYYTDAPYEFIFDFVESWIVQKQSEIFDQNEESQIREAIKFNKQDKNEIDFTAESRSHTQSHIKMKSLSQGYSVLPRRLYLKNNKFYQKD